MTLNELMKQCGYEYYKEFSDNGWHENGFSIRNESDNNRTIEFDLDDEAVLIEYGMNVIRLSIEEVELICRHCRKRGLL